MSSSSSSPSHDPRDAAPADPPPGYPDLGPQPVDGVRLLRAPAVPTAVVRATGVPMATIAGFFDSAFGTAFPALFAAGVMVLFILAFWDKMKPATTEGEVAKAAGAEELP